MAYATVTDALEYYSTQHVNSSFDFDRDGTIAGTDLTRAAKMLESATSKINGYIVGRVALPLATVPEDLVQMCLDIALYLACPDALSLTEEKTNRYNTAMSTLKDIRSGKYRLVVGSESAPAEASEQLVASPVLENNSSSEASSIIQTGTRELSREKLSGLI